MIHKVKSIEAIYNCFNEPTKVGVFLDGKPQIKPGDFIVGRTTEGASRTDLEGEQLNDGRVGAVTE